MVIWNASQGETYSGPSLGHLFVENCPEQGNQQAHWGWKTKAAWLSVNTRGAVWTHIGLVAKRWLFCGPGYFSQG